jgi:hypothetical protein
MKQLYRRSPFLLSRLAVRRHDRRAAEADVVLKRRLNPVDLALVRPPANLPRELRALREAGGAERVVLEIRPPDGLTTQPPPYVVSSESTTLWPSPSWYCRADHGQGSRRGLARP